VDSKDTAYLAWLEPDFAEIDKISKQERRKAAREHLLFEIVCGAGFAGLLCILCVVIAWIHNTGVALR